MTTAVGWMSAVKSTHQRWTALRLSTTGTALRARQRLTRPARHSMGARKINEERVEQ